MIGIKAVLFLAVCLLYMLGISEGLKLISAPNTPLFILGILFLLALLALGINFCIYFIKRIHTILNKLEEKS